MAHKGFKGTSYKKSFLILKEKEAETVASVSNNTDENATIEDMASFHSIHNSSQGEKVSLLSMASKKHRKENYQVEVTLTKFANIHIQNDIKYTDAAQRILLQQNVSTLSAANVSDHNDCYQSFRSPGWERSSQKSKSDKIIHNDESTEFFKLISYHIIERHEIYTLAQPRKAQDEFTEDTRLRSLDA